MLRSIAPGSADFEAFVAALQAAKLPTEDLLSEPFSYFCFDDIAWGGFGSEQDALIRSIVVSPKVAVAGAAVLLSAHSQNVHADKA